MNSTKLGPVDLERCCHVSVADEHDHGGRCPEKVWEPYHFCETHAKIAIAQGWLAMRLDLLEDP